MSDSQQEKQEFYDQLVFVIDQTNELEEEIAAVLQKCIVTAIHDFHDLADFMFCNVVLNFGAKTVLLRKLCELIEVRENVGDKLYRKLQDLLSYRNAFAHTPFSRIMPLVGISFATGEEEEFLKITHCEIQSLVDKKVNASAFDQVERSKAYEKFKTLLAEIREALKLVSEQVDQVVQRHKSD